jgi:nitrate/nitrite transporter NarK
MKYGYTEVRAGEIISLIPLTSMVLSPLFGIIVDKIGKRVILGKQLIIFYFHFIFILPRLLPSLLHGKI